MVLLIVVSIGGFFTGCEKSRASGSTVTGRSLRLPVGSGVPFVRVLVEGPEDTRLQVTDSGGTFTINHVPTGSYTVTFAFMGVQLHSTGLVIDQDEETYVVDLPDLDTGIEQLFGTVSDF